MTRAAALNLGYGEERDLIKAKLTQAFLLMRQSGLIARQSFKCCRSCASGALVKAVEDMSEERRARVLGACFYTHQDADVFRVPRGHVDGRTPFKRLWLAYGPVCARSGKEYGKIAAEVGDIVKASLEGCGLEVSWDGNGNTSIIVVGLSESVEAAYRIGGHEATGFADLQRPKRVRR